MSGKSEKREKKSSVPIKPDKDVKKPAKSAKKPAVSEKKPARSPKLPERNLKSRKKAEPTPPPGGLLARASEVNLSLKKNNQETEGIGLYAESSLHSRIKFELAEAHDRFEVKVAGKVVDLVRHSGELVEVQTGNFGRLKSKVDVLGLEHDLRVVYPIASTLHIVRMNPATGEVLSRRKSPKKADWLSVFDELVYFPDLFLRGVHRLELLLVEAEEIRLEDGKGSWRRKGQSIGDRRLVRIIERKEIAGNRGMLHFLRSFLSAELPETFTSGDLVSLAGGAGTAVLPRYRAGRILYVLKKAGLVAEDGKKGRSILYRLATPLP